MYCDPGIRPEIGDTGAITDLISHLSFFGFRKCAVICNLATVPIISQIQPQFPDLSIYSRVIFEADSVNELKGQYKKNREKFDLISVRSHNPEVLNFAARDTRFHILSLPGKVEWSALNAGIASLAAQFGTGIEFPLAFLLHPGNNASFNLRLCRKAILIARLAHAPILLSSWGKTKYELIGAKEITILARNLFGIPSPIAKLIGSEYPEKIINKAIGSSSKPDSSSEVKVISQFREEVNDDL